jgi:hypothetical protein
MCECRSQTSEKDISDSFKQTDLSVMNVVGNTFERIFTNWLDVFRILWQSVRCLKGLLKDVRRFYQKYFDKSWSTVQSITSTRKFDDHFNFRSENLHSWRKPRGDVAEKRAVASRARSSDRIPAIPSRHRFFKAKTIKYVRFSRPSATFVSVQPGGSGKRPFHSSTPSTKNWITFSKTHVIFWNVILVLKFSDRGKIAWFRNRCRVCAQTIAIIWRQINMYGWWLVSLSLKPSLRRSLNPNPIFMNGQNAGLASNLPVITSEYGRAGITSVHSPAVRSGHSLCIHWPKKIPRVVNVTRFTISDRAHSNSRV